MAARNLKRVSSCRKASPTTWLCSPLGTARRSSSRRSSSSVKFACLIAGRTRVTSYVLCIHLQSDIAVADRSTELAEALTARAIADDREQALAAAGEDLDIKPIDLDRLVGKIEGLLGGKANA